MTAYERQVADALAAVSVRGPARFAWMGRLEPGIDAPLEAAMDDAARREYLVGALADRLRRSWYCHGRPIPARRAGGGAFVPDYALLAALSDANGGRGTFQRGWTVERLDGDVAVSSDGMLRARVPLADIQPLDGAVRPGAAIAVRLPKELEFYAPGFDYMLSDADLDAGTEQLRVYWHVTERGAVPLVRMLTSDSTPPASPSSSRSSPTRSSSIGRTQPSSTSPPRASRGSASRSARSPPRPLRTCARRCPRSPSSSRRASAWRRTSAARRASAAAAAR